VRVLRGADAEVLDLAFSPDGTAIAAGFKHHPVYLWNLESATPNPVRLATDGGYSAGGLRFSTDGRSLWWRRIGGYRGYNRDAKEYASLPFPVAGVTHGMGASSDGSRVVSQHGIPNHCLIGWEPTPGGWNRAWTVSIADLSVESITLSPDGRFLALISRVALGPRWSENPREIEIWDGTTGRNHGKGTYPHDYPPALLFAPDSRVLVGINDMTLLVWPVPNLGEPRLIRNDSRKDFTAVAFHPSGRHLYVASNDATVHIFETATWERIGRFTWQIGKLKSLAVSADGTLAAAGGEKGEVVIWDVDE
jgi:WD40 repeat protein